MRSCDPRKPAREESSSSEGLIAPRIFVMSLGQSGMEFASGTCPAFVGPGYERGPAA
jgi:hypothetical protein